MKNKLSILIICLFGFFTVLGQTDKVKSDGKTYIPVTRDGGQYFLAPGSSGQVPTSNGTTFSMATPTDNSITNEGALSVGAGGGNSATIVSNTSGSTPVTIEGGTNVTVTENTGTGTITITAASSSLQTKNSTTFSGAGNFYPYGVPSDSAHVLGLRLGSWKMKNASAVYKELGSDNGLNVFDTYKFTETDLDTLQFDCSEYNKARMDFEDVNVYVSIPSNYNSNYNSETFVLEFKNNSNVDSHYVSFDTTFFKVFSEGEYFPPMPRILISGGGTVRSVAFRQEFWAEGARWICTDPGGIISLGGQTQNIQVFAVSTTGTDFAINSAGGVHTFHLPNASATARGVINATTQTIAGVKTFSSDPLIPDEAYDATNWDGVLEPPTKNAIRDKIESLSTGTDGVWTPTLTGVLNVGASTAYECQYLRVGSTVTFSGKLELDPTATGVTGLGISLPIASNFTAAEKAGGTAKSTSSTENTAVIYADSANDRLTLYLDAADTANQSFWFSGSYRIQ